MKSKLIAISAISASFTAIVLTLGAYIELFDIFALVVSSVFVILPLYYHTYKGCFLCFFAGGVLAFIFSGFNIMSIVFPAYFLFFGIYPIVRFIAIEKKFNKMLFGTISLLWCVAVFYGLYYYYTLFLMLPIEDLPKFVSDNILYFVAVFGVVFYFIFDRFIFVSQRIENIYLQRILK